MVSLTWSHLNLNNSPETRVRSHNEIVFSLFLNFIFLPKNWQPTPQCWLYNSIIAWCVITWWLMQSYLLLNNRVTMLAYHLKCAPLVRIWMDWIIQLFNVLKLQSMRLSNQTTNLYLSLPSTKVDTDEIKRLGKRFRKLDLDNSGALSIDEFMSLPELQQNPLVQRVIDIFDTDQNGEVDFKGKFSPRIIIIRIIRILECRKDKTYL